MKTRVLLVLITALMFGVTTQAQRGLRLGYIDMEYILENVEEYQEANNQLNTKVLKWKGEIEQQKNTIEQMKKDLSVEKVLLTKELIVEREEEIQILEKEMLEYQQDRFGPQGDLVVQRNLLVKPIQDQVFNAVQEIAKNKRYDFVFDKSADVVMLYSAKKYDISDLVLRSINRTIKRNERTARSQKDKFDEGEETVNPEVEARQQAAAENRAAREQALEERRQQKLKEREERKKAYEERRKKLLEERAAKKKAKEDAKKKDNEEDNQEEDEN